MRPAEQGIKGGCIESLSLSEAPTVLQVLPRLEVGGVERGTVDVAGGLKSAGWNAVVASSGGRMVADVEAAGAVHVTLPLSVKNPAAVWRNATRLEEVIRDYRVDIIHARSRAPAWSALMAARKTRTPFITTVHGLYGCGSRAKRLYNSVMTRGDRVIAVSNFVKNHVIDTYCVPSERVRVIHRGVDVNEFHPGRVTRDRVASMIEDWLPSFCGHVIILPGRASRIKGHTVLVDAVRLLDRKDIRVLMVGGDGKQTRFGRQLRARIREAGLSDVIRLTPPCRDMPAAYSLADIVVSASTRPEAFGRVSVEAQAMGRPVIATALGGSIETIRDGETGWLVPAGDPGALARTLNTVLQMSPGKRKDLGNRARAHVREHFTISRMLSHTLAVYGELLDVPSPG